LKKFFPNVPDMVRVLIEIRAERLRGLQINACDDKTCGQRQQSYSRFTASCTGVKKFVAWGLGIETSTTR